MTKAPGFLFAYLHDPSHRPSGFELATHEKAELYVDTVFATAVIEYLEDQQRRLLKKENRPEQEYQDYLHKVFAGEFQSLQYLLPLLAAAPTSLLKKMFERLQVLESDLIEDLASASLAERREFMAISLPKLEPLFQNQEAISLYRNFDSLDRVLGLDYQADLSMKTDIHMKERLYEGSGVGVQSSYVTLFSALQEIAPRAGMRIVDLGSGYGRLGFVVGFLHSGVECLGYEYVAHRVARSELSSAEMGLSERVKFFTQDLADKSFSIPEADVYYMFDPFCEETYQYVLKQLMEISKLRQITIVTKGGAREWVSEVAPNWEVTIRDNKNLCLFTSPNASPEKPADPALLVGGVR